MKLGNKVYKKLASLVFKNLGNKASEELDSWNSVKLGNKVFIAGQLCLCYDGSSVSATQGSKTSAALHGRWAGQRWGQGAGQQWGWGAGQRKLWSMSPPVASTAPSENGYPETRHSSRPRFRLKYASWLVASRLAEARLLIASRQFFIVLTLWPYVVIWLIVNPIKLSYVSFKDLLLWKNINYKKVFEELKSAC